MSDSLLTLEQVRERLRLAVETRDYEPLHKDWSRESIRGYIHMARTAEAALERVAELEAALKQRHLRCPECGPIEFTDEDGCCKTCGGDVVAQALEAKP